MKNQKIKAETLTDKIIKLEKEQLKLIDKDVFTIDKNGWTNQEKWWALNDKIEHLERLQEK